MTGLVLPAHPVATLGIEGALVVCVLALIGLILREELPALRRRCRAARRRKAAGR